MHDDWRVRITLHEHGLARALTERIEAGEVEHELERAFHERVVVSADGAEVFCYAGTREQAERARELIRSLAAREGWRAELELCHWHPDAERWEDPEVPLPRAQDEREVEHGTRIAQERADATRRGYPDWEVRVECDTRERATQLGDMLRAEGLACVRRHRYLLLGAPDEDSAQALVARVRRHVPEGTPVTLGASMRSLVEGTGGSPFAILGGLAGGSLSG